MQALRKPAGQGEGIKQTTLASGMTPDIATSRLRRTGTPRKAILLHTAYKHVANLQPAPSHSRHKKHDPDDKRIFLLNFYLSKNTVLEDGAWLAFSYIVRGTMPRVNFTL